jgi:hypothetical protein
VVIALVIRPKVREFKSDLRRWVLRAINIHSTASFLGEVKLSAPSRKILRHVKNPYGMKHTCRPNSGTSRQVFLAFLLDVLLVTAREFWWVNHESLEPRFGSTIDQKTVAVHGKPCVIPSHKQ